MASAHVIFQNCEPLQVVHLFLIVSRRELYTLLRCYDFFYKFFVKQTLIYPLFQFQNFDLFVVYSNIIT